MLSTDRCGLIALEETNGRLRIGAFRTDRSLTGWPRSDPLRGPLSASEGIRVIRQVAEGLRFASASGLIHRRVLRQS